MELVIVLASLAVLVFAYFHVSMLDGSLVNVLTPAYAVFVPTNYLVEAIILFTSEPAGSTYAYFLSFSSYAVMYLMIAVGYSLKVRTVRLPMSAGATLGSSWIAWALLGLAILFYAPVLVEFRNILLEPRRIYEQTRSGYGLYFFTSTMLCHLATVCILFSRAGRLEKSLFIIFGLLFLYLHGSKAHVLTLFFILSLWWVYAERRSVSVLGFSVFVVLMGFLGLLLFLVTNPGLLLGSGILEGFVGYSDYTRNGMLAIDAGIGPTFGAMTLEQEFYTRVPRVIYPEKPNDFGGFQLAELFFPEAFNRGTGAPSFGYGVLFTDFHAGAIGVCAFLGFFSGVLMRIFVNNVRGGGSAGDFIMLLFGCGTSLIPISGILLLPENLVLAIFTNVLLVLLGQRQAARRSRSPKGNGG